MDSNGGTVGTISRVEPVVSPQPIPDSFHEKQQQPWAIFRFVARYPKASVLVCLLLQLGVWVTTIGLFFSGYNIFPINFKDLPIQLYDSKWYQRTLAVRWAYQKYPPIINKDPSGAGSSGDFLNRVRVDLIYSSMDNDNILTQDNLLLVKKFETELLALPGFETYYDLTFSLLKYIPKGMVPDNRALASALQYAEQNITLARLRDYVLPRNAQFNRKLQFVISPILRSVFFPRSWSAYSSKGYTEFLKNHLRPFLNRYANANDNGRMGDKLSKLQFSYWSLLIYQEEAADAGLKDSYWAFGSLLFILFVLLFHTRSPALTAAAVFGIVTALAGANLIYNIAFGRRYIGVFHAVSIFVLLGIGADDVFVLYDTWRDSFADEHPTPAHRLAAVFHRAAGAMLITSVTSATAFLVNAGCRVPLVATFGLFTGLAVIANYLMVISFLPCVLMMMQSLHEWRPSSNCCRPAWIGRNGAVKNRRTMARFFQNVFFPIIRRRLIAGISVGVCLILACFAIWQAVQLGPSSSVLTQMFGRGTNFDRASHLLAAIDQTPPAEVELVFGINLRDRSACKLDDYRCYGEFVPDKTLDLRSANAQEAMVKLCRRLRWDEALGERLAIRRVKIPRRDGSQKMANDISCYADVMEDDAQWALAGGKINGTSFAACTALGSSAPVINLTVPVTRVRGNRLLTCRSDLYGSKALRDRYNFSAIFDRYYETGVAFWLQYAPEPGPRKLGSWPPMSWPEPINSNYLKFPHKGRYYGGRILEIKIIARTRLTTTSDTFFTGLPIRDAWDAFVKSQLATMPATFHKGFHCMHEQSVLSPLNLWEWYDIQHELWMNARIGILLGLFAVALPILLLATRANILLTGGGLVCLGASTASVMGLVRVIGWPLGVSESINLALVTGLSVDYIVHFIEAFHLSEQDGRLARTCDMLTRVGGAVTSGAFTTIGATMFLFGAKVLIFVQFGTILCVSIACAFFYAIFLLTPLLILAGPNTMDSWSLVALLCGLGQRCGCAICIRYEKKRNRERNRAKIETSFSFVDPVPSTEITNNTNPNSSKPETSTLEQESNIASQPPSVNCNTHMNNELTSQACYEPHVSKNASVNPSFVPDSEMPPISLNSDANIGVEMNQDSPTNDVKDSDC